jgi:hypothetical protein
MEYEHGSFYAAGLISRGNYELALGRRSTEGHSIPLKRVELVCYVDGAGNE